MISYIFILKDKSLIEELRKKISDVSDVAVWIGVSSTQENEAQLKEILDQSGLKYNLIINSEDFSDYYKLDQFIQHLRNGWTYVHEIGKYFREDVNKIVEDYVSKGYKFAMISDGHEDINDTCFYSLIFRMLRGNRIENNQMINFYDKVERESPKMIKSWFDVNMDGGNYGILYN